MTSKASEDPWAMRVFDKSGLAVAPQAELTELTFTGQRRDRWTGTYYYGARLYDPMIARFVSLDPMREHPNRYAYVAWSPVRFVDPTGTTLADLALRADNLNLAMW